MSPCPGPFFDRKVPVCCIVFLNETKTVSPDLNVSRHFFHSHIENTARKSEDSLNETEW